MITGSFSDNKYGEFYKIENMQDMPAFFINIATPSDIWMFLSSNGALTAGRCNADGALFPYETDDRLHLAEHTGPKTLICLKDGRILEPFDTGFDNPFRIQRSIYKRTTGDAVLFEEINETLNLAFSYIWETSEKYGIVRTACLENRSGTVCQVNVLDGVENIIPYGIAQSLVENSSCLTDAYKVCERVGDTNLVIYSLTSAIVDTPEPVEVLRANVAWSITDTGVSSLMLSSRQIRAFAKGESVEDETQCAGQKGAYIVCRELRLEPETKEEWMLIMDAQRSQKQIAALVHEIEETPMDKLRENVKADIQRGTCDLLRIVAAADGLQTTSDKRADVRHYMNVLYNNMRGGVFLDNYEFDIENFMQNAASRSHETSRRRADFFSALHTKKRGNILELHKRAFDDGDADIIRLCLEFLPLTFSRRHGDPSRPWNRFNIRVKDDAGSRVYAYEGNWRDIFQNWEALSQSFPGYIAPVVAKFLNASTADGFNPYRINQDGIDWEVPEPDNPWSGYGYWGDHQIVYLSKLLEWLEAYTPDALDRLMEGEIFAYANVPYEIKPYADILKNSKDAIYFNKEKHERMLKLAESMGSDAKLLMAGGKVYYASFIEKLLIPILAKISNLVPEGGIWMNTNRPEWNDANNAIVGNGLSMVTVYQLYRHLCLCRKLIMRKGVNVNISLEVMDWLRDISALLIERKTKSASEFMDCAGGAFERYRMKVYAKGFSGKDMADLDVIATFFDAAIDALAETIDANKRSDGMYHSYNILVRKPFSISPMFLMLEGQTAVLGSGRLGPDDALSLVLSMDGSGLLSDEHQTYFLYPKKKLKAFIEKNIIPADAASGCKLISQLIQDGSEVLAVKDADGKIRFADNIRQSSDLEKALKKLSEDERLAGLVETEADKIRDIYEIVFAHREFTGRSGIMYKYEGIGSIYWHQNSKFMLSFREVLTQAVAGRLPSSPTTEGMTDSNTKATDADGLKPHMAAYDKLRSAFGFNKEPPLWGAFPLEPYSHTPYGMPAQQPGMTGQVKEDILTRLSEMGIEISDGKLCFNPALLRRCDFCDKPGTFSYIDLDGVDKTLALAQGQLALTVCQVPIVYTLSDISGITVYLRDGRPAMKLPCDEIHLDETLSRKVFMRENTVERIEVEIALP